MILNNINFLSFLIIIVFAYLIYDIYKINNTQLENFFGRRRRRGPSIFSRVINFFNIARKIQEEREKKAAAAAAAAAAREAERRLLLDNRRTQFQTNLNNLSKQINETSIPNLSKSSQSTIKKMNDSNKILKNIYIKSLKNNTLNNYINDIYT